MPNLIVLISMTAWLVAVLCAAMVGYVTGYNTGVRDTERRWSDAVNRKVPNFEDRDLFNAARGGMQL